MRTFTARHVADLPDSTLREFFDLAARPDVLSLGTGEPDFPTPPPIVEAAAEAMRAGATKYTANAGIPELRAALADHLKRLYGVAYDPETEIVVTVGVSEALLLSVTAILDPGDEVVVPEPSFPFYRPTIRIAGGRDVAVPAGSADGFRIPADRVDAAVTGRTKAILFGSPCNPTGAVASQDVLEELAGVARRRDLLVISDEIYGRLVYGVPHVCVASLPGMRERTLTLGGFSKSHAMTGWRVGYVAGPAPRVADLAKIHQHVIMSTSTIGQIGALAALREGEPYVRRMVAEYARRRRVIVDGLNELGLTCVEPCGAFYAFPSIATTGLSDMEFCRGLLESERVAVVPGSAFGESGAGHVRCTFAASMGDIREGLARIGRFLRSEVNTPF